MGMYVYIYQRKYIPYLSSIHALSPYELSHTIIPVTCVYNGFNNGINHFICTSSFIISYYVQSHRYPARFPIQTTAPTSTDYSLIELIKFPLCNAKSSVNHVHFNFNGISHISAIGPVPSKTCLRLTPRGPALRVETHFPPNCMPSLGDRVAYV